MTKEYELAKELIGEWKYKVIDDDGDCLTIRYQMNTIHICPNSDDTNFIAMILPNFANVNEDNFSEVIMNCHKLNEKMKQVKYYTINDCIIASCEFYFMGKEDLAFQMKTAFSNLVAAKVNYKKISD